MLMSFLITAGVYALVSFVAFAFAGIMRQSNIDYLSILFLEWLMVSFFIFGLIMCYIIWSTPPNA